MRLTPMHSAALLASCILAMDGGDGGWPSIRSAGREEPEEEPCLNCGKSKRHNNSFCSGKCCRQWKQRRAQR